MWRGDFSEADRLALAYQVRLFQQVASIVVVHKLPLLQVRIDCDEPINVPCLPDIYPIEKTGDQREIISVFLRNNFKSMFQHVVTRSQLRDSSLFTDALLQGAPGTGMAFCPCGSMNLIKPQANRWHVGRHCCISFRRTLARSFTFLLKRERENPQRWWLY